MKNCPYRAAGCTYQHVNPEKVDDHVLYMLTIGDDEHTAEAMPDAEDDK